MWLIALPCRQPAWASTQGSRGFSRTLRLWDNVALCPLFCPALLSCFLSKTSRGKSCPLHQSFCLMFSACQLTLPFPLLSSSLCLSIHLGDVLLPAPAASSGGGASACPETRGLWGQDGGSDSETSQPEKGEAVTPQMASFEVTLPLLFLLSWLSVLLPTLSCWSCTFSWGKCGRAVPSSRPAERVCCAAAED